jgi:hypothetical protein
MIDDSISEGSQKVKIGQIGQSSSGESYGGEDDQDDDFDEIKKDLMQDSDAEEQDKMEMVSDGSETQ